MGESLAGVETEYAFAVLGREGRGGSRDSALQRLMSLAQARLVYLQGGGAWDLFMPCGRLYVDIGGHPEFCTPECTTPWEVVRYTLAGDRILEGLANEVAAQMGFHEVVVHKGNVDYTAQTTWGSHESYLYRMPPAQLCRQVIPHLVSRTSYTGAGGFDPFSRGLVFAVSPRVLHLERVTSYESTGERAIVHLKDEPLGDAGYHRLHLLCGESNCSHTSAWLKVGTTALVVAMADAGLRPGEGVQLKSSLDAMRAFALDPTCRARVESSRRRLVTALDIQRHYLELAEAHLSDAFMPAWAGEVTRLWRKVLGMLEGGPESVSTTLDWAIKLALYKDRVSRAGLTWESLGTWTRVHQRLLEAIQATEWQGKSVTVDCVLGPGSPVRDEVTRQEEEVSRAGLTWDGFGPFLGLRQELFEIDARYGQLGAKGIFGALDRAGVLSHAVAGVDRIDEAMREPPAAGRARVRGEWIERLSKRRQQCSCHWDAVFDRGENRVMVLSDPFCAEGTWRSLGPKEELGAQVFAGGPERGLDRLLRDVLDVGRGGRAGAPEDLNVGDEVLIRRPNGPAGFPFVWRRTRVISVQDYGQGRVFRLAVDGGTAPWSAQHLELLARATSPPEIEFPEPPGADEGL